MRLAGALLTLFLLTCITVYVSRLKLGSMGIWVALFVAAAKSSVVLLIFMHIKKEGKAVMISFLAAVFILALVIGILFFDLSYRAG